MHDNVCMIVFDSVHGIVYRYSTAYMLVCIHGYSEHARSRVVHNSSLPPSHIKTRECASFLGHLGRVGFVTSIRHNVLFQLPI